MDTVYQNRRIEDILALDSDPVIESQINSYVESQQFTPENKNKVDRFNFVRVPFPFDFLNRLSNHFYNCLDSRVIPLNFPSIMLALALHLISKDGRRVFLCPYWPEGSANAFDSTSLIPHSVLPRLTPTITRHNDSLSDLINLSDNSDEEYIDNQEEIEGGFPIHKASFLAAYLLKMLTKTSNNVFLGLKTMRDRFLGFYPWSFMPKFSANKATFEKIRLLLNQSSLVRVSWIETIANFESVVEPISDHAGMVRYLANMPFSYTGMHAYPLLLELKSHTKRDYRWILRELYIPDHEEALLQLKDILNNYERCLEYPLRLTHFKYARMYSPTFFLSLHSKKCASLIYLLTQIVGRFLKQDQYGGLNAIMAISKVGGSHKLYLDVFARIFYERMHEDGIELYYSSTARLARVQMEQEVISEDLLNIGDVIEEE